MLARFHRGGADFAPLQPQPQAGFVVQLGRLDTPPSEVVREFGDARPAVADYLGGRDLAAVDAAPMVSCSNACAPVAADLPLVPLHGDWQTNNLFFDGRADRRDHRLPPGRLRAAAARPGGRDRAQLLLLEPDLRRRRRGLQPHPRAASDRCLPPDRAADRRRTRGARRTCSRSASSSTESRSSTTTGGSRPIGPRPTGPGRRSCSATPQWWQSPAGRVARAALAAVVP